jgi:hypothetical protein
MEWRGMSRQTRFPMLIIVDYDPRRERQRQMDKLAGKYVETHDQEIIEALYQLARLARELEKIEKLQKQ